MKDRHVFVPSVATLSAAALRLRIRLDGPRLRAWAGDARGRAVQIRSRRKQPHFPARAKRVIFLFMHGGPSHMDTFDPKPRLTTDHGKPLPFKRPLTFAENSVGNLLKSPWEFRKHGQSGLEISELFPQRRQACR